jgi:hypothetical protein
MYSNQNIQKRDMKFGQKLLRMPKSSMSWSKKCANSEIIEEMCVSADKNNGVYRAKTHIFDEQEMAVPREHIDKIDAENPSRLPANCRSRNKTWRKNGIVCRKLSDSLYHNFTQPLTIP